MAEHQDPERDAEPTSSDRPRRAQMSPRERRRRNRRGPRHAAGRARDDDASAPRQRDVEHRVADESVAEGPDEVEQPVAEGPDEVEQPVDAEPDELEQPIDVARPASPGPRPVAGTLPPVRRSRRVAWSIVAVLVVAAAVVVALLAGWLDRAIELVGPAEDTTDVDVGDDATVSSAVVVTYDADDPAGTAARIVVLTHDPATGDGTVLLVPTATVADVPGYGAFSLGEAFTFGGAGLVEVSLANLLGVRFDVAVGMSDASWRTVFDQVGPIEVAIAGQQTGTLPDGSEVTLAAGDQRLDATAATDLLHVRFPAETELESMPRVQQVFRALFDAVAATPASGDLGITADRLDLGTPPDSASPEPPAPERLRELLRALAQAQADDAVTVVTLPVATLGTGRDDSYRLDAARAETLVADRFTALRPADGPGVGASVQVLNGNGVPAIGQRVAERLSDGGYRIVLTDNADRFDYERTRIVVYDGGDETLAIARDVRERLGVGDIERSATPQSVVDVTIVVGQDFTG